METFGRNHQRATMTLGRDGKILHKSFSLDCAYPPETSQVWFIQRLFLMLSLLICLFISRLISGNGHTCSCGEAVMCTISMTNSSSVISLVLSAPLWPENWSDIESLYYFPSPWAYRIWAREGSVRVPHLLWFHRPCSWWIMRRSLSFVLTDQAEVCAGVLGDVIRCVLSGNDGCVLGLGCADVGE